MTDGSSGPRRVVILGIDGVGKTTQAASVARRLRAGSRRVELYTRSARLDHPGVTVATHSGRLLLARAAACRFAESAGRDVDWWVSDRYWHCHAAIDAMSPDSDLAAVRAAFRTVRDPDVVVWLEAQVEVCRTRQAGRGPDVDPPEYLERLRAGYLGLPEAGSFVVVDAGRPLNEVQEDVWTAVARLDPRLGAGAEP